ncbi:hypothetical protein ACSFB8_12320 [Enterococcus faecalis]
MVRKQEAVILLMSRLSQGLIGRRKQLSQRTKLFMFAAETDEVSEKD